MNKEIVQGLLYKLPFTLTKCFTSYAFLAHLLAILLTYVFIASGIDWAYFTFFKEREYLQYIFFPALYIGFYFPIVLPAIVWIVGMLEKNLRTVNTGFALVQSGFIGLGISILYKMLTGRVPPEYVEDVFHSTLLENTSSVFHFGFGRGGVTYGWPSGHTIVAISMVVTILTLYPRNKLLRVVSLVYGIYIALSMSTNLHWLSDILAAGVIAVVVGRLVGKNFVHRYKITV